MSKTQNTSTDTKIQRVNQILNDRYETLEGMHKQIQELEKLQQELRPDRTKYRDILNKIHYGLLHMKKEYRNKMTKTKKNTRKANKIKTSRNTLKTSRKLLTSYTSTLNNRKSGKSKKRKNTRTKKRKNTRTK